MEKLAEHLDGLAHQIELLAQQPVMQPVVQLNNSIAQQLEQQQLLQAQVAQLQQGQQQLQAQVAQLQDLCRASFNIAARAANGHARRDTDPLAPLLDTSGAAPPGFPATRGAIGEMSDTELIPLLAAYGLPTGGHEAERRAALQAHVGCL
jgi:hypothetical protein